MHKQLVQYTDYDGVNQTENVYFNLDADVILDNLELSDELQDILRILNAASDSGEELTTDTRKTVLNAIKKMMRLSYGVRIDNRFVQGEKVWEEFTQTACYKALLRMFLTEPEKYFVPFATGIIPKDLMVMAEAANEESANLPEGEKVYTRQELLEMPQSEFDAVVGTDPLKMSQDHLRIAFQRKGQTGGQQPSEG